MLTRIQNSSGKDRRSADRRFGRSATLVHSRVRGFILLEVVIAIGVFMVAITGIVVALNTIIDAAMATRKENAILVKMETRLAEARFLPLQEGTFPDEERDPDGVLFTRIVTPLELKNKDEVDLANLYRVQMVATWQDGVREETQSAELYVLQR